MKYYIVSDIDCDCGMYTEAVAMEQVCDTPSCKGYTTDDVITHILNMPEGYEKWDLDAIDCLDKEAGFNRYDLDLSDKNTNIKLLCVAEEIDLRPLLKQSKDEYNAALLVAQVSLNEKDERMLYERLKAKFKD